MDPITIGVAFAGAQAAVKGIKEVLALGKEVESVTGQVLEFFNHRAVIDKANKDQEAKTRKDIIDNVVKGTKKTRSELTAEAFDIAYKAKVLMRQEYEIYQHLVWSGNGDLWHAMVAEREKLIKLQEAEEAEELKQEIIRKAKAKENAELKHDIAMCAVIVLVFVLLFWGVVEWMISKGMVLR